MDIRGKVALVTGGGTGLGRVIAHQLAAEGMNIAIQYAHSQEEAVATVTSLRNLGVRASAVQGDLHAASVTEVSRRLIDEVANQFGRLDLLINNAGTTRSVPFAQVDALTEADWDAALNVNTKAPFLLTQAAVPLLRQQDGGQVINTASIAGLRAIGSSIAYAASKAALIHLTKCLAVALAPEIRVNAIAPGLLQTRWIAIFTDEQLEAVTQLAPLKKAADLDDTASAYVMLAKNESMTGAVIAIDAGVTAV
jgi:3-oxoacyl-[acyl-carrier protein] reductase